MQRRIWGPFKLRVRVKRAHYYYYCAARLLYLAKFPHVYIPRRRMCPSEKQQLFYKQRLRPRWLQACQHGMESINGGRFYAGTLGAITSPDFGCRTRRLNQALSLLSLSVGFFWVCPLCCYLGPLFMLCYLRYLRVVSWLFSLGCQYQCKWLTGKDSSPKWPIMCWRGR